MTLSRVYINPSTGVGPDAADLVPFATIMLTPDSMAAEDGSIKRLGDVPEHVQASQGPLEGSMSGVNFQSRQSLSIVEPDGGKDAMSNMHMHKVLGRGGQASHGAVSRALELFTAKSQHTIGGSDSLGEYVNCVVGAYQCMQSFVGMSQCSGKGSWDVCCQYVQAWSNDDCWNADSGQLLLNNMPTVLTPALLQVLGRVCDSE
jgi:hypothetical protein